jgi:hypothetical protein
VLQFALKLAIMKNILLPTDLTVQSLRPVHDIVKDANGQPITIHVVHLISLPTSITDLLFHRQNKPYQAVPATFMEAVQLLRNKYAASVEKIVFDFVFCNTTRYFNNFLEGNNIDAVYMINGYHYLQPLKQSEKVSYYLNKCKVQVCKVAVNEEALAQYQNLSALLNNQEGAKNVAPARTTKPVISYS